MADEYDAAQERGEVATQSRGGPNIADGVPGGNTVADLGLARKAINEARQRHDLEVIFLTPCGSNATYTDSLRDVLSSCVDD